MGNIRWTSNQKTAFSVKPVCGEVAQPFGLLSDYNIFLVKTILLIIFTIKQMDVHMRVCFFTLRYGQGHAGIVIISIIWRLLIGSGVRISLLSLSCSLVVCTHSTLLKIKLYVQHSTSLQLLRLTVLWITNFSRDNGLLLSMTTKLSSSLASYTCSVLLVRIRGYTRYSILFCNKSYLFGPESLWDKVIL